MNGRVDLTSPPKDVGRGEGSDPKLMEGVGGEGRKERLRVVSKLN